MTGTPNRSPSDFSTCGGGSIGENAAMAGGSGGSRGFLESIDAGKTHEILVRLLQPSRRVDRQKAL
jgi:hypothetical protein